MAKLIKTDGTETIVYPAHGKSFTLQELQKLVGGYIEMVRTVDGKQMIINEEGKLNDLPVNDKATVLYVHCLADVIVGDAVILEKGEIR